MSKSATQSIGVFCASSLGDLAEFRAAAVDLGEKLAQRDIALVCGGGSGGLMGALIHASASNGGRVIGVVPQDFIDDERPSCLLSELHIVKSIKERKESIVDLSDSLIALPGGVGTIDEIFATLAAIKLGVVRKPFGILNVMGYYDIVDHLFDVMIDNGFAKEKHKKIYIIEQSVSKLLDSLETRMLAPPN
ncbi:TIGR00730 family Rossman fold protein [Burkholderia vietnamiensis]|uniref:LOG family protein n=1 Tax=Burkholderia vietnamiensis TaxID=60552 RepID=UPI001B9537A2|nr:TIGR00730 family Rossman fold protein [Burkholderia vietnamiensis]MBR8229822.1 TIGR00730 family Rossman fold protein [Burkholderia vietnamiensis]